LCLSWSSISAFQSDIITIFVGPGKKRFTAHKKYLTKSDYFKAGLERGFKEGDAGEINLLEDKPGAIDVLLQFLSHDRLPGNLEYTREADFGLENRALLIAAYVTAEKYCIEELRNKIVDQVAERCKYRCFRAQAIAMLTDADLVDSKLRKLLLQNVAHGLMLSGYEVRCMNDKDLPSFVSGGGVNSVDLLKATLTLALTPNRGNPAHIEAVCDVYRVHKKTKQCEKAK
jgi:hypothetical protein